MFAYIGRNLVNLNKILSIEIVTPSNKYVTTNIKVTYENKEDSFFTSGNPEQDLENIFQMMKDSE